MSFKETKGNIIDLAEEGVIDGLVHGCNCMHAMGSGIAGELAIRYPEVPAADIDQTILGDMAKLGTYSVALCRTVEDPSCTFNVFNMYTQRRPGGGEDVFEYAAFTAGCMKLRDDLRDAPEYVLGFPRIGAGLAGGDWKRIRSIIETVFGRSPVTVVFVEWDGSSQSASWSLRMVDRSC